MGTPQQNDIAERKNNDLLEKTRSIMFQMNVPKKFWSQGVLTAAYLINRLPSRVLNFKSPYEVLKGRKLDISHLKVFGCVCFVHIQTVHRDKLDPKAAKCIFLGYSSTQKGYKCFNPSTRKLLVSRDVRFSESTPFFSTPDQSLQGEFFQDFLSLPMIGSKFNDDNISQLEVSRECVAVPQMETDLDVPNVPNSPDAPETQMTLPIPSPSQDQSQGHYDYQVEDLDEST